MRHEELKVGDPAYENGEFFCWSILLRMHGGKFWLCRRRGEWRRGRRICVGSDERSAGTMLDDATITAKVKTELIGDKSVKARNIDVDTVAGVVVLSGYVDSQQEANRPGLFPRS